MDVLQKFPTLINICMADEVA